MKYYKTVWECDGFTKGNIYPGDFKTNASNCASVADYARDWPEDWKEVTERKYLLQEGKVKAEFVLPEKWCIKVKANNLPKEVHQWRSIQTTNSGNWVDAGYIHSTAFHYGEVMDGFTKITLAQFKKYVLKETKPFKEEKATPIFPERWTIKGTDESRPIVIKWLDDNGWEHSYTREWSYFAFPNWNNGKGFEEGAHTHDNLGDPEVEDYVEISLDQFKKYVLKEQIKEVEPIKQTEMRQLAKTFKITGSEALLGAIGKELINLGYTTELESSTVNPLYIANSYSCPETIGQYKDLFYGNITSKWDVTFNLPSQYNEALAFAKEQLSDKYWVKEPKFKVGDMVIVVPSDNTFSAYPRAIGYIFKLHSDNFDDNGKLHKVFCEVNQKFIINYREKDIRLATPEEVKAFEEKSKPKFKVGDWIIYDGNHKSGLYQLKEKRVDGGFNDTNDQYRDTTHSGYRLATREEIEEHLLSEAKRRYPAGTVFRSAADPKGMGRIFKVKDAPYMWNRGSYVNSVANGGEGLLYINGEWAEIITNSKPTVEINGYEAEFTENWVIFGCQKISKEVVAKLVDLADHHITMIDFNGESITPQIKQINKYFNSL